MNEEQPNNAAEVAKTRRRAGRIRIWFWSLVALMLLSPFSCFVGMGISKTNIGIAILLFGSIAPVIGLGGAMLMWNDSSRANRRVRLADEIDLLGFEYIDQPEMKKLRFLNEFQVITGSWSQKATCLGRGRYREAEILVMDFSFVPGGGDWRKVVVRTLFVLTDVVHGVPGMVVQPQGFWSAGGSLKVKGEEAFNRRYSLASKWFEDAPRFISRDLAELCLEEAWVCFEVRNGDLLVYWGDKLMDPRYLLDAFKTAVEIGALLRASRD